MESNFIKKVIGEKGQWREFKARGRQLPPSYRTALDAFERYLNYFGTGGDSTAVYGDLVDLFEQSAAAGTPIREVVGDDPVEFIQTLVANYPQGQWIIRERQRLARAIDSAAAEGTGPHPIDKASA